VRWRRRVDLISLSLSFYGIPAVMDSNQLILCDPPPSRCRVLLISFTSPFFSPVAVICGPTQKFCHFAHTVVPVSPDPMALFDVRLLNPPLPLSRPPPSPRRLFYQRMLADIFSSLHGFALLPPPHLFHVPYQHTTRCLHILLRRRPCASV